MNIIKEYNSIDSLEFNKIPSGSFHFGTKWDKYFFSEMSNNYKIPVDWLLKEVPGKKIHLDEFEMSTVPITVGMMREFYLDHPHLIIPKELYENINMKLYNLPAYPIDFEITLRFTRWISRKTREVIDLPTEAEWEKASRGDRDKRIFPWGEEENEDFVNIKTYNNSKPIEVNKIGNNVSQYGIYDLSGNIEEWTLSYNKPYKGNPIKFSEVLNYPILRGGTCEHDFDLARCSRRHGNILSLYRGFRIVRRKTLKKNHNFYEPHSPLRLGDVYLAKIYKVNSEFITLRLTNEICTQIPLKQITSKDFSLFKGFAYINSEMLVRICDIRQTTIFCERLSLDEIDNLLSKV